MRDGQPSTADGPAPPPRGQQAIGEQVCSVGQNGVRGPHCHGSGERGGQMKQRVAGVGAGQRQIGMVIVHCAWAAPPPIGAPNCAAPTALHAASWVTPTAHCSGGLVTQGGPWVQASVQSNIGLVGQPGCKVGH